jgi:hypothetical protein
MITGHRDAEISRKSKSEFGTVLVTLIDGIPSSWIDGCAHPRLSTHQCPSPARLAVPVHSPGSCATSSSTDK